MPQPRLLALILTAMFCLAATAGIATAQDEAPKREAAPPVIESADQPADVPAPDGEIPPEPGDDTVDPEAEKPKGPLGGWEMPVLLLGVMLLFFFFSGRSRRKQEATRKQMLANLKKGDKVTSIGGIIGTVMDIREDEVVVKVDESTNTRMRFARSAISRVGEAEEKQGA